MLPQRRSIRKLAATTVLVAAVAACGTSTQTEAPVSLTPLPPETAPPASAPPATSPAPSFALPQGSDTIDLDPSLFAGVALDNPFWPMAPGSRWVYRETDADGTEQQVEVTVTDRTKDIAGIPATEVHDLVTEDGEPVEDTLDWYAQDTLGNLWYLGEDTKEYENGKVVSTEGSWEAGVDGAQAGIILPADPQVGQAYRQEYYAGQAEDAAEVVSSASTSTCHSGRSTTCSRRVTSRRSSRTSRSTSSTRVASDRSRCARPAAARATRSC